MNTSMYRFLQMRRDGTLMYDVTWRGYAIEKAARWKHARLALKQLSLAYAGELGVQHFARLYEVPENEAEAILGEWWLWSQLTRGARPRVPLRGPVDAPEAPTLADDPPKGA